jgi:hypothetical protein
MKGCEKRLRLGSWVSRSEARRVAVWPQFLWEARKATLVIALPLDYYRRVLPGTLAWERCQLRKQRRRSLQKTPSTHSGE